MKQPFTGLLLILLLTAGCSCNNQNEQGEITQKELKEPLIRANKKIVNNESRLIDSYVERRKWKMTETGTGLRYMIYKQGNGIKAEEGKVAVVRYEISLLDGTVCYSSKEDGVKDFLIGKDNVESGLHEGITYMHVGDKAKLILPSYMAHGIAGDQHKIPPRSVLIFDLELLSLH